MMQLQKIEQTEAVNPLSPNSAKKHYKTHCFKKKLQLSQSHKHCFIYQGYFVSWRPIFQFNEQRAKFVHKVQYLTRFIEKVDSELPSSLMLIRQPLKMKNGCELTKNRRCTIFEPLLQFNEVK